MKQLAKLSLVLSCFLACHCQDSSKSEKQVQSPDYTISVDEVFSIVNDSIKVNDYVVLDVRGRMDYIRGHLVSSYWLSVDSIDDKIPLIGKEPRPIILYDENGMFSDSQIWRTLHKHRSANIYMMKGGFAEWTSKGYPAAIQLVRNTNPEASFKPRWISSKEAYKELRNPEATYTLIDIRHAQRYREAHIPGATSIPFVPINEFVVKIEERNYPRSKPIILYCDAYSDLGEKASDVMMRNDFTNVFLLEGGLDEWARNNLPLNLEGNVGATTLAEHRQQ